MHTLFDSFFGPTTVLVVSEERLKQVELETKENQLKSLDHRIEELTDCRTALAKEIKALAPTNDDDEGAECDV
tara:strand:- start:311 stop:529 length:219 start_codon:yes stop_codon:yes gene_type:complete